MTGGLSSSFQIHVIDTRQIIQALHTGFKSIKILEKDQTFIRSKMTTVHNEYRLTPFPQVFVTLLLFLPLPTQLPLPPFPTLGPICHFYFCLYIYSLGLLFHYHFQLCPSFPQHPLFVTLPFLNLIHFDSTRSSDFSPVDVALSPFPGNSLCSSASTPGAPTASRQRSARRLSRSSRNPRRLGISEVGPSFRRVHRVGPSRPHPLLTTSLSSLSPLCPPSPFRRRRLFFAHSGKHEPDAPQRKGSSELRQWRVRPKPYLCERVALYSAADRRGPSMDQRGPSRTRGDRPWTGEERTSVPVPGEGLKDDETSS